jgi:O-antigen ligase
MPFIAALIPRFFGFTPALMAIAALPLFRISTRRWFVLNARICALLSLITGLCLLSALWSFDAGTTLARSGRIAAVLLSGAALFSVVRDEALDLSFMRAKLAKFFPLAMLAAGLMIMLDLYGNGFFYLMLRGPSDEEINYSHMNRSVIAFIFLLLPALWTLWRGGQCSARIRWGLTALLAAAGIIVLGATQSQSAQMAVAVALLFFIAFPYRCKAAWHVLGLGLIALVCLSPWLAQGMFGLLAAHVEHTPWLSSGYAAPRMEIWDMVARRALEQPFFGHGLEATRDIAHFETQNLYNPMDHVLHPHNFALQIWIEFGAMGVALVCAFFAVVLKAIFEQPHIHQRWLLSLFMALIAVAATSYGLWQAWWLGLMMTLALLCAVMTRPEPPQ